MNKPPSFPSYTLGNLNDKVEKPNQENNPLVKKNSKGSLEKIKVKKEMSKKKNVLLLIRLLH